MDGSGVEVGPAEDTILSLLELLVDPLLPSSKSLRETPSPSQEESIAKQVHAVVLLYNYYHRKWKPEVEFLDFESFCKLFVVLKKSLFPYLKLMQKENYTELEDLDKQLSLTEKAIMDACDISKGLDASKDFPNVEGWPIGKIAVFLVDYKKLNCFLFRSSISRGAWSIIEKVFEIPSQSSELEMEEKPRKKKRITKKPQKENWTADEGSLQQLAYLAVKGVCGTSERDLRILESHVVYSLSKEKTATRFYIMQCTEANQEANLVPIVDVMDSLQGLIVRKDSSSWIATSVVEYFHLLPYIDLISEWLSREGLLDTLPYFKVTKKVEPTVIGSPVDMKVEETTVYCSPVDGKSKCGVLVDAQKTMTSHDKKELPMISQPLEATNSNENDTECKIEEPCETVVYKKRSRSQTK